MDNNNFERYFQEIVRQLRKNKRKLISQRIITFLLIISIILGLAYLIVKNHLIPSYSLIVDYLIIIVLAFILGWVIVRKKNILKKRYKSFLEFLKSRNLKQIKRPDFLGFFLLTIALIYQAYPSIINVPLNDKIIRLRYNPTPPIANSPWSWKEHKNIHPVIARITPDIEKSIQSVAQYIAQQEPEPYLQIKALHDYVINRVTYDKDVLKTGIRPAQDAQSVFITHKAVCEGYANLFLALGRAIGIDVVFVGGRIRPDLASIELIPENLRLIHSDYDWTLHAWNAVKVRGNWQLVDTTWDDSKSENPAFYSADYLMPPPQVMIISHLPENQAWQLLRSPEDDNSFEKQPILTPQFFAEDLTIMKPTEYQTNVQGTALLKIKIPSNSPKKVLAFFSRKNESGFSLEKFLLSINPSTQEKQLKLERCESEDNKEGIIQLSCHFPEPGDYQVSMFSGEQETNSSKPLINYIGQLKFHFLRVKN